MSVFVFRNRFESPSRYDEIMVGAARGARGGNWAICEWADVSSLAPRPALAASAVAQIVTSLAEDALTQPTDNKFQARSFSSLLQSQPSISARRRISLYALPAATCDWCLAKYLRPMYLSKANYEINWFWMKTYFFFCISFCLMQVFIFFNPLHIQ